MKVALAHGTNRAAMKPRWVTSSGTLWIWLGLIILAIILPWICYDWSRGRHSGFAVSMFSQMGLMIIFALSYNMQLGQAGLLSFGHAVFFGLGGYITIHALNAVMNGSLWVPVELMPLVGALSGLLFALLFGYLVTKRHATAFAMITLGLGELIGAAAVMFNGFFGGEGGVTADRMVKCSLLGLDYGSPIQVYYLILVWTVLCASAMLLLTQVPLGRMANACRDNSERVQFIGYDPHMVRFLQYTLSGLFAGVAGALYAIDYEIVTYDAVSTILSGNALLMTFIGGIGVFWGPIVGAILITLFQSWMSLLSNAWEVYVGVLFVVMVIYAPGGIAGIITAHEPIWRAKRLSALTIPYLRIGVPVLVSVAGFVGLVELTTFATIGAGQGKMLVLFSHDIDVNSHAPWLFSAALCAIGSVIALGQRRAFVQAWQRLNS
jgi:branched-chain amino acid transport system permease protein